MNKILKAIMMVAGIFYPIIIFFCLVVLKLPMRIVSLCIMIIGFSIFLSYTAFKAKNKGETKEKLLDSIRPLISSIFLMAAAVACFITNQSVFLKLYSVVISLMLLIFFGSTLFFPPVIIFRFATLSDKTIIGSINEKRVERYCRKVCVAWCCFFIINGTIAAYTALYCSDAVWSIYNGGISYGIMGMIFAVEFLIRRKVQGGMPQIIPLSEIKFSSRKKSYVLCFDGKCCDKNYKTWQDFLADTAKIRGFLTSCEKSETNEWVFHCEDNWNFLCALTALLQCKKTVSLINDTQALSENKEKIPILNDEIIENINIIPDKNEIEKFPSIDQENSRIYFSDGRSESFTLKYLEEFVMKNIKEFHEELTDKKLITTIGQKDGFNFLFGITMAFMFGLAFNRKTIESPSKLETVKSGKAVIISDKDYFNGLQKTKEALEASGNFVLSSDLWKE